MQRAKIVPGVQLSFFFPSLSITISLMELCSSHASALPDDLICAILAFCEACEHWSERRSICVAAAVCSAWRRAAMRLLPPHSFWTGGRPERDFMGSPALLFLAAPPATLVRCHLVRTRRTSGAATYTLHADDAGGAPGRPVLGQPLLCAASSAASRRARIVAGGRLLAELRGDLRGRTFLLAAAERWSERWVAVPPLQPAGALVLNRQYGIPCAVAVRLAAGGGARQVMSLRTKTPQWNGAMRFWSLDFEGRVREASIKNMQLVREEPPGLPPRIVLQLGRVSRDLFVLDFAELSAVQALSIALSRFV